MRKVEVEVATMVRWSPNTLRLRLGMLHMTFVLSSKEMKVKINGLDAMLSNTERS
jgi:hypothetical protein